jgi:uncharacterized protein YjbJ (UPF0337 family)
MNDNQTNGIAKTIKGGVKEAASKVTGNKLGEVEGKVEKGVGQAQTKLGNKQEEHRDKTQLP